MAYGWLAAPYPRHDDGRLSNACLVFDDRGILQRRYDKTISSMSAYRVVKHTRIGAFRPRPRRSSSTAQWDD